MLTVFLRLVYWKEMQKSQIFSWKKWKRHFGNRYLVFQLDWKNNQKTSQSSLPSFSITNLEDDSFCIFTYVIWRDWKKCRRWSGFQGWRTTFIFVYAPKNRHFLYMIYILKNEWAFQTFYPFFVIIGCVQAS